MILLARRDRALQLRVDLGHDAISLNFQCCRCNITIDIQRGRRLQREDELQSSILRRQGVVACIVRDEHEHQCENLVDGEQQQCERLVGV